MNAYFVMPAPLASGDIRAMNYDKKVPIEGFFDAAEADRFAQKMARRYPGVQFWIMNGAATKAFRTEPLPVQEGKPLAEELS